MYKYFSFLALLACIYNLDVIQIIFQYLGWFIVTVFIESFLDQVLCINIYFLKIKNYIRQKSIDFWFQMPEYGKKNINSVRSHKIPKRPRFSKKSQNPKTPKPQNPKCNKTNMMKLEKS